MANEMERVEKFEKMISKVDGFIQGATSFLYDHIEDPDTQEIIECIRAIVYSNLEYLDKRESSIDKLRQTMATVAPITQSIVEPSLPSKKEKTPR
ncbi:MAG: hypothetical protein IKL08_03940, partial [Clostridia bacterium]|nr:hypothetical protein [Clostridia bacterium]